MLESSTASTASSYFFIAENTGSIDDLEKDIHDLELELARLKGKLEAYRELQPVRYEIYPSPPYYDLQPWVNPVIDPLKEAIRISGDETITGDPVVGSPCFMLDSESAFQLGKDIVDSITAMTKG